MPTGQKYEGEFKNSKRDGFGKNVWPDGKICEGIWKDNSING